MAIAKVADRGTATENTSDTSLVVTLAAGASIQVGNHLLVRLACDNAGLNGAAPAITVADNGPGLTYFLPDTVNQDPGAANAGVTAKTWVAPVTAAFTDGAQITFTFDVATTAKAVVVEEWTGIHFLTVLGQLGASRRDTSVGASGTPSFGPLTPAAAGELAYGTLAIEGPSGDTYTQDSDTVDGSWVSLTSASGGGTTTAGATIRGAYKLVTGVSAQTWDPTITSRDWAGSLYVFQAAATGTAVAAWGTAVVAPDDIADLVEWWKPEDITGITDGQTFSNTTGTWPSAGPGGTTMSAPAGASYCTYETGVVNGLPVVRFGTGAGAIFYADIADLAQPNTVLAVFDTGRPWETNNSSPRQVMGDHQLYAGTVQGDTTGLIGTAGVFRTMAGVFNGASSLVRVNGAVVKDYSTIGSIGTQGTNIITPNNDGGTKYAGDLAELIVFDRVLTTAELEDLENYLDAKYDLNGGGAASWTGTAAGQSFEPGSGAAAWGAWTATAAGQRTTSGTAQETTWSGWTATATGPSTAGTAAGAWGAWTGAAAGAPVRFGVAAGGWGAWTAAALGAITRAQRLVPPYRGRLRHSGAMRGQLRTAKLEGRLRGR